MTREKRVAYSQALARQRRQAKRRSKGKALKALAPGDPARQVDADDPWRARRVRTYAYSSSYRGWRNTCQGCRYSVRPKAIANAVSAPRGFGAASSGRLPAINPRTKARAHKLPGCALTHGIAAAVGLMYHPREQVYCRWDQWAVKSDECHRRIPTGQRSDLVSGVGNRQRGHAGHAAIRHHRRVSRLPRHARGLLGSGAGRRSVGSQER